MTVNASCFAFGLFFNNHQKDFLPLESTLKLALVICNAKAIYSIPFYSSPKSITSRIFVFIFCLFEDSSSFRFLKLRIEIYSQNWQKQFTVWSRTSLFHIDNNHFPTLSCPSLMMGLFAPGVEDPGSSPLPALGIHHDSAKPWILWGLAASAHLLPSAPR